MTAGVDSTRILDIAIIGGGAAGAYCAYRLLNTDPKARRNLTSRRKGKNALSVHLFESSERIGGRLWSYRFPGLEDLPAELGGLGFNLVQQNTFGLCTKELCLKTEPLMAFSQSEIQYLRDRRLTYDQYALWNQVPYYLSPKMLGKDPFTIVLDCLEEAMPGLIPRINTVTRKLQQGDTQGGTVLINELCQWLRTATASRSLLGQAPPAELWNHSYWDFLLKSLSCEGYSLIQDSWTTVSENRARNLYDGVLAFCSYLFADFYPNPSMTKGGYSSNRFVGMRQRLGEITQLDQFSSYHLPDGYDTLPQTLVKRFEDCGGKVHTKMALQRLDACDVGSERLLALTLRKAGAKSTEHVLARNVILAVPQKSLQLLDSQSVIFEDHQFRIDMNGVYGVPAATMYAQYKAPWWKKADGQLMQGFSVSDLPMNACYYIGQGRNSGNGLLRALLADDMLVPFWEVLQRSSRSGMDPEITGELERQLEASSDLKREVHAQLEAVHGHVIPTAERTAYWNWGDDPYGAAWHFWKPAIKTWEAIPRVRRPNEDLNVFLCGEAYSAVQGWVEGALNTAEMVLEDYFDLPRPTWVMPEYDFGP